MTDRRVLLFQLLTMTLAFGLHTVGDDSPIDGFANMLGGVPAVASALALFHTARLRS